MNSSLKKQEKYRGAEGRLSPVDLEVPGNFKGELILFAHGYMGYKDWGAWNLVQRFFTSRGFAFCKFNFSHNGGTPDAQIDFPDLEAFAANSYSKEVYDLQQVLDYIEKQINPLPKIHLLGHSRGGGIVLLNANDKRVSSVITLAAISSIAKRFSDPEMLAGWKTKGVRYVTNQRTKQAMPHHYAQVLDFEQNREKLSIEKACRELRKPLLIVHGDQDTSVPTGEGQDIAAWTGRELTIIRGADHTFGSSQPWNREILPAKLSEACEKILDFLKRL